MSHRSLVAVIDDDDSVRESLPDLLGVMGYAARSFASAEEFLASDHRPDCLLLDVAMGGMSGLELQRELIRQGRAVPVVFITALSDKSLPPGLLQHGAVDCLFKPFSEDALRAVLAAALPRA